MTILEQIRANQLAVISLVVALTALTYSTWRNEQTEANRNVRRAGFEMLVHVSALQQITYLAHFDGDTVDGNPRKGWTEVLVLKDLATLMPDGVERSAADLADVWGTNWSALGREQGSVDAIDGSLDRLRVDIQAALAKLK